MNTESLIERLAGSDINIALSGTDLEVNYPDNEISEMVLEEIAQHKQAIVSYLQQKQHVDGPCILPAPVSEFGYPLSPSQRRSWIISQSEKSSVAYNMNQVAIFEGNLDIDALIFAFEGLIERHESLRTVYRMGQGEEVRQFILSGKQAGFRLSQVDLRSENKEKEELDSLLREEVGKPFDLSTGPVLRASLYWMTDHKWVLVNVLHHITGDSWSMNILKDELLLFYKAATQGNTKPLKPLRIHYKDYTLWKLAQLKGRQLKEDEAYWLKKFEGEIPVLELPTKKKRPAIKTYNAEAIHRYIDKELLQRFKLFCRERGGTLFMGLIAVLNTVFYRYTQQEDTVIGFPIADRDHPDLKDQIGFYAATLALRTRFDGSFSFTELLELAKSSTLEAYEHRQYPFDMLINKLNPARNLERSVLFDVFLILQKSQETDFEPDLVREALDGLEVRGYEGAGVPYCAFDLIINLSETAEGLKTGLEYNCDIYDQSTVSRFFEHLIQMMEQVLKKPHQPISSLNFLTETEKKQLLEFGALEHTRPLSPRASHHIPPPSGSRAAKMDFSLLYFGSEGMESDGYRFLMEGARYADRHGYSAIWTPERHFHPFGGPYPNPSVLGAAIAAITETIGIRAGSVVLPLHHPLRVAEEWAVVDHLSQGRVGIACAPGWNANDFVLSPDSFDGRHDIMYQNIQYIEKLWRGDTVSFKDGNGVIQACEIFPKPYRKTLPIWMTISGNIDNFKKAGHLGMNILTGLLNTTPESLRPKIDAYREAYAENGHPVGKAKVALMMHTYLGKDEEQAYSVTKEPLMKYLLQSLQLSDKLGQSTNADISLQDYSKEDLSDMLEHSFEWHVENTALIGTEATCRRQLKAASEIGVDEIACLTDFGVDYQATMDSLERLTVLKNSFNTQDTLSISTTGTIVSLFEEQVERYPYRRALTFKDTSLSYQMLNEQANQCAEYLKRELYVQAGDIVAIQLDRSHWTVVTILGILKTGAAYLPLENDWPQDRIDRLLSESGCCSVIDTKALQKLVDTASKYTKDNPDLVSRPFDLAYVLYTSGSTGVPKGVMVEHKNVVAFFKNMESNFHLLPSMTFGAITNYSFDVSVMELLGTLANGMHTLIMDEDPRTMLAHIDKGEIDALQLTPSRLSQLLELKDGEITCLRQLKVLLVGGEVLSPYQYGRLKELGDTKVFNVYGPTETTLWSTSLDIGREDSLSIGRPLKGEHVLILDKTGNLCPLNVKGEIYIGGDGVARGYLNQGSMSEERFLSHPIYSTEKVYRTGDMGRWLPNGTIEFLGRQDGQVKLRGYRIELGEIEQVLLEIPEISQAVCIKSERNGDGQLIGYVVKIGVLDRARTEMYLASKLPRYMIPRIWVELEAMPLLSSGKADRKALLERSVPVQPLTLFSAPGNQLEEQLCPIWEELLEVRPVGIDDNFFELGGHSLIATRLVGKIKKQLHYSIEISSVLQYPTVASLAGFLLSQQQKNYAPIAPLEERAYYELSPAQRRMWLLSQREGGGTDYAISGGYILNGYLEVGSFIKAFDGIVKRHEILRTTFPTLDGLPVQKIDTAEECGFAVTYHDFRGKEDAGEEVHALIKKEVNTDFDLEKGPLFRVLLVQLREDKYRLALSMHHIISDAWSLKLIVSEIGDSYNADIKNEEYRPAPLTLQYKEYAEWQNQWMNSDKMAQHKAFWMEYLKAPRQWVSLPFGSKGDNSTEGADVLDFSIPKEQADRLDKIGSEKNSTMFVLLLSCLKTLVYRYTGDTDIIIGSLISGRDHPDILHQIGCYVNVLAIRTLLAEEDTLGSLLSKVRNNVYAAWDHQEYPFDELVRILGAENNPHQRPLFNILFSYEKNDGMENTLSGVSISPDIAGKVPSDFDVDIMIFENPRGGLTGTLTYPVGRFHRAEMVLFVGHFQKVISMMSTDMNQSLIDLELSTDRMDHKPAVSETDMFDEGEVFNF